MRHKRRRARTGVSGLEATEADYAFVGDGVEAEASDPGACDVEGAVRCARWEGLISFCSLVGYEVSRKIGCDDGERKQQGVLVLCFSCPC